MYDIDLSHLKGKKTSLVFSGGVVKAAAWHLGVSLALDELGIHFTSQNDSASDPIISPYKIDSYVGSSAGALISLYLASGYGPQEIIRATLKDKESILKSVSYKDMLSLKSPLKRPLKSDLFQPFNSFPTVIRGLLKPLTAFSGFFTTYGLKNYLLKEVLKTDSFEELHPDVFIVATQLDHSRKVIFSKYNYPNPPHDSTANYYTGTSISDAAAASMSVPPFYAPFPVENPVTNQIDYYIDGEIRDTLSSHVAIDHGAEVVICSWTHSPYHFREEIGSLINYGLPAICLQSILLLIQKKIISNRSRHEAVKDLINTINQYMKDENFSTKQRVKITSIIEQKLHHKSNVKFIDIYPAHKNHHVFFSPNFSLSTETTSKIVKMGYKKTMNVLEKVEW